MITKRKFGTLPNGQDVYAFDLTSQSGLRATILEYGAILQSLCLPSGLDIVLGFDELAPYLGPHPSFGTAIGRMANRTREAAFSVDGTRFSMPANAGQHNLHGGPEGFDRRLWQGKIEGDYVVLTHTSPDGHQGFPGRVRAQMIFSLQKTTLSLDMMARTDKTTPINLTHHSYFNLTDGGVTPIDDHDLIVLCKKHLELDHDNIPTGRILNTSGTMLDYSRAKHPAPDLDDCWIKHHNAKNKSVKKLAKLMSSTTGHMIIICSTQPGLQVYSGAHIGEIIGKSGALYGPNHGIALEPQNFPNAVNEDSFPSPLLKPDALYHHTIRYTVKTAK